MKTFLRFALLLALAAAIPAFAARRKKKKESLDLQIARYAAIIGTNRLAADSQDPRGLALIGLAKKLSPLSEIALLTTGYLERGMKPKPIKTKVTEEKLIEVMVKRAEALRITYLPKNEKVGELCLMYYRVAEECQADKLEVPFGIMKLKVAGIEGDLTTALKGRADLKDIFGKPRRPKPRPKRGLMKADREIARQAAVLATNRLAKDEKDEKGLILLRLAGTLQPDNDTYLLTTAFLAREKWQPVPIKTKATEKKLVDLMLTRAEYLRKKELRKNKNAGRLCLLYYKVAEKFQATNPKIILGLQRLKVNGIKGELDELLDQQIILAKTARERLDTEGDSGTSRITVFSARGPRLKTPWTVPGLGLNLVAIKEGTFLMGSNEGEPNARPVHKVTISRSFWMGKYEITQAQYKKLINANPSRFKGDKLPVETVNWNDAVAFAEKLTVRERKANRVPRGYVYRLPTEAEWEYACRAESRKAYYFSDRPDNLAKHAWYSRNSGGQTHEVGRKRPNRWRLYDMPGNVAEWCLDWYGEYSKEPVSDPTGPDKGSLRVVRGEDWHSAAQHCSSAYRGNRNPRDAHGIRGFRVVLAPATKKESQLEGKKGFSRDEWEVRCWENDQWTPYPLRKMKITVGPSTLRAKNTTGIHNAARLTYKTVLNGDFEVQLEAKGRFQIALHPASGQGGGVYLPMAHSATRWRSYRVKRVDGKVQFWENGKSKQFVVKRVEADAIFLISIGLRTNQEVELRRFKLTAGPLNRSQQPTDQVKVTTDNPGYNISKVNKLMPCWSNRAYAFVTYPGYLQDAQYIQRSAQSANGWIFDNNVEVSQDCYLYIIVIGPKNDLWKKYREAGFTILKDSVAISSQKHTGFVVKKRIKKGLISVKPVSDRFPKIFVIRAK